MTASIASAPPKPGTVPAHIQLMQITNAFLTSRCLYVAAELGVGPSCNRLVEALKRTVLPA